MDVTTLIDEESVDDYFRKHLQRTGAIYIETPALKEVIRKEFEITDYPTPPKGTIGLIVPRYRWVIRNEDLALIESILEGFKNAASVGFFMPTTSVDIKAATSTAIGLVSIFFKVLKNVKNKSAQLTKEQFQVIVCLKNHPSGLTFDQLFSQLNIADDKISRQRLAEVIESLKTIFTNDTTKLELIISDNNFYKVSKI